MDIFFLLVSVVLASVIVVVLAINMRISGEVAQLRAEVAELERARNEIAGMINDAREAIGTADRDMKKLRTELRSEMDHRIKSAASGAS